MAPRFNALIRVHKFLFMSFVFLLTLCSAQTRGKKFVKMFLPDGYTITAELAVTLEERQLGLMHRKKIDPDQGMLLVFEQANYYSIWMKNMKIPLTSSGWIGRNGLSTSKKMSPRVKRTPALPTLLDSQRCMSWR